MKETLIKYLNKLSPKGYNDLEQNTKVNILLITGNFIMWSDDLVRLCIYLFNFNIEVPISFSTMLSMVGIVVVFYSWRYTPLSLSNFKFYRKYIRRNKIWIHTYSEGDNGDGFYRYRVLSDLYITPSENTSDCVAINIKEVINNHNLFGKDSMLAIIEGYEVLGQDINDYPDLTKHYIKNHSKKNIEYVLDKDIYLINLREKNINDILEES